MLNPSLERTHVKQSNSIEQYVDKITGLDRRTIIQYDDRWNLFLKKHSGKRLAESLPLIVQEIIDLLEGGAIKHSTFRLYRASVCYGLSSIYLQIENESISDYELEEGLSLQLLSNLYKKLITYKAKNIQTSKQPDRTSATKKKSFPKDFYKYLEKVAENEQSPDSRTSELWAFVQANLIVGLRPVEWLNARIAYSIKDRVMLLIVKNAKNSNGRANGDERTLRLLGISRENEECLNKYFIIFQKRLRLMALRFLENHKQFQQGSTYQALKQDHVFGQIWDDYEPSIFKSKPLSEFCTLKGLPKAGLADLYLRSLQREMHKIYNQFLEEEPSLSEKRVTLYSTRHQCIANAKSSKVNIFEIAAFFGHSSKETSSRHYGKAWSGWSSFAYRPSLESILAVTDSLDYVKKAYGYEEGVVLDNQEIRLINNDIDYNF